MADPTVESSTMTNAENTVRWSDAKKPDPLPLSKSNPTDVGPRDATEKLLDRKPEGTGENGGSLDRGELEDNTGIANGNGERPSVKDFGNSEGIVTGALGVKPESLKVRMPNSSKDSQQPQASGHKPQPSLPGNSTTTRRPSVQFTRDVSDNEFAPELAQSRPSSIVGDDADPALKGKQSILTKLKAFASPSFSSHSRSPSGATIGDYRNAAGDLATPASERGEFRFPNTLAEEGSDIDADAEESAGEQRSRLRSKKKKQPRRRQQQQQPQEVDSAPGTAPTTPRMSRPSFNRHGSFTPFENYRPFFPRRASSAEIHQHREGVSEDEGRDRLNRDTTWRRRSAWLANSRSFSYRGANQANPEERRSGNLRRLAGLAGPSENPEGLPVSRRRQRGDRGTSLSAQRWRQIKAGLKLIGQRRKADNTVDHAKSAELLAELTSGVPAALILASMFQRDEHGSKRIPILLEQLKVRVTDSRIDSHSGDRHLVFRIELEYGSGMTRMKWIIHRTLRDLANLHLKYKLHFGTQKYIQLRNPDGGHNLPRFPRSAFPYLRGVRGLESDMEDEEDEGGYETGAEAASGTERGGKKKKSSQQQSRRSSMSHRRSSVTNPQEGDNNPPTPATEAGPSSTKKESYPEKQRKKLEAYLQKMIRFLIFRPDSNRLCKFLELSALGVRLAAEGSYHGKEGFLIIQSAKGLDFRRALTPGMLKNRHSPKWFLVRHSYVVCVDSPEQMNIYDVFLVDPFFKMQTQKISLRNQKAKELAKSAKQSARHPQHHTLKLENSERKLRLLARNERQMNQFEDSIRFMVSNTPWARPNRFDSYAPVRGNCFAQWLVDARDHMWMVSRAINQAKDVIYIHDWWLSPELYMRRPAAISQKWRLDRLLQRKARDGVKIFVIMYRNINSAIPIDSEYSKFSLLDLHPNVFVQRSPNQFRQNTFFWAHHEKLCIIDHTLAFVGGIDLCFGRWDTPQHQLTDDKPTGFETAEMPKDSDHCQLWPGKDYSNPRIQDFYELDKPYEEMYDRNTIPRMPWHDISMHVVGQPARDLTRHFVQRWNYILRQRKPTRPTPFLLPPPDFDPKDLEALGLDGTCEVQILRSSSMWSTGTPDVTEHSIMNAYVKMIEESEHFVYIENQFFISTCEIDGRKIENLIGDALVERIARAARNGETWRAAVVIPLMPGFQNTVDSEGGTSVRLIMQCQYRSICRGETSIFGRLHALGIDPQDYIQFFSLRTWGKIGDQKRLVTEQLYIHAKCMVVDDRAAIIGSANINERSMLGSRDSEVASVVRDTDMIWSTMNGQPYLVGRFAHTLRMRLMREHLGIDVDELMEHDIETEEELQKIQIAEEDAKPLEARKDLHAEAMMLERQDERDMIDRRHRMQDEFLSRSEDMRSFNHDIDWEQRNNPNLKTSKKMTTDARVTHNPEHRKDVNGDGPDGWKSATEAGLGEARDSTFIDHRREVLLSPIASEGRGTIRQPKREGQQKDGQPTGSDEDVKQEPVSLTANEPELAPSPAMEGGLSPALHPSNQDAESSHSGGPPQSSSSDLKHVFIDKDCMRDPVTDIFYLDTWQAVAEKNTKIYRNVFRCMPDSEVRSWKEYKEYALYGERFAEVQNQQGTKAVHRGSVPPGSEVTATIGGNPALPSTEPDEKSESRAAMSNRGQNDQETTINEKAHDNGIGTGFEGLDKSRSNNPPLVDYSEALNRNATQSRRRRRRATTLNSRREFTSTDEVIDMARAEEMLNKVQGHLILWPYDWYVVT